MQFTPEQQAAIYTTDKNLIIRAGAGSGKTRVLVERFMALLESDPAWTLNSIVAITFTEKAAREMRDRIRRTIQARIADANTAETVEFWRKHEASLESARIYTIHGLCGQILRANPVESRVDPRFQVLDDIEGVILRDEVVEQALTTMVDSDTAKLLQHYGVQKVRNILKQFISGSQALAVLENLNELDADGLMARWEQMWKHDCEDVLLAVQQDKSLAQYLAWADGEDLPPDDKFTGLWKDIIDRRDDLYADDLETVVETLRWISQNINLQGGSSKKWGQERLAACKAALRSIRDIAKDYSNNQLLPRPGAIDQEAANLLLLWRDAVLLVHKLFTDLKNERDVLDFDDLELQTVELLRNHPSVAGRYAGNDGEIKHVMVDEFQDTNDVQRAIIYYLCGIDIERGIAPQGRLFVVGDPKQSIYAFRGADVSVFDQVQQQIVGLGGEVLRLSHSFRSHTRLVEMFNVFFQQILIREASPTQQFYVEYEAMIAHRESLIQHETPVSLWLLPRKPEDEDADKLSSDDLRQWEAWELGQYIKGMVESETPIWDKDLGDYRPLQYGDVAILFQSLTKSPLYEQVFQNLGLPYITVAGKGYFDRQEVWDLMNLLRVLHNPADNLALASVLRSPMFGVSDDGLLAMRLRQSDGDIVSLWEAMWHDEHSETWQDDWFVVPEDDGEIIAFARDILSSLHALAGRVTIAELLNYALEITAFEATLTGLSNGERRRANIQKLLDLAQKSGRVSLSEFNTYLEDMVASEAREGEAALEAEGVITLMSVHKSKGLEFPVVVLADTSWSRTEIYPALFVDSIVGAVCNVEQEDGDDTKPFAYLLGQKYAREREWAERKRLLYVAATRAQDYLMMSGELKRSTSKIDWISQIREALSDRDYPLNDDLMPTDEPSQLTYGWGNLELRVPTVPQHKAWIEYTYQQNLWDQVVSPSSAVASGHRIPAQLPLMRDVVVDRSTLKRHINATQLERLGRIPFEHPEQNGRADFRRMLLHDMPQPVKPIAHEHLIGGKVPGYIIGEVVHRALKVGLLPNTRTSIQFEEGIRTYAWELGVTHQLAVNYVVKEARRLLNNFVDSDAYKLLETASQINREIEFLYEHHNYIIHGIIDVLFFANQQWHIMDYKTNRVDYYRVEGYSLRYRYQMGAYAKAVEQQTGQIPVVCLHYLHPNRLYTLPTYEWQEAMEDLDTEIEVTLYASDFESGEFDE